MPDPSVYLILFGWIALTYLSGWQWERHRLIRSLPIVYGTMVGILIAWRFGHTGIAQIFADLVSGTIVGLIFSFAVWLEVRFSK